MIELQGQQDLHIINIIFFIGVKSTKVIIVFMFLIQH